MRALSVFGVVAFLSLRCAAAHADPSEGGYAHGFASLGYGRGLRWNNPFRLQTELGSSPSSVSLSAGYWDLGVGASFGPADGLQQGGVLHFSLAANGVPQGVLSASYLVQFPLGQRALSYGRLGLPLVLSPATSFGGEAAAGAVYFVTGAVGVNVELVQSVFFGAATWERDSTVFPVTSCQLGLWFDYEVLP